MSVELLKKHKSFDGWTEYYRHESDCCGGLMRFSVFRPPQAEKSQVPVLYWLSGLTCTEENFMVKSGIQKLAAEAGILVVAPDTSPRDTGFPDATKDWDFGEGAGFYVNATEAPWSERFRMYDYVVKELPELVKELFPVLPEREGISGHSMGGHGAMMIALRNPGRFRSVSAFSPIVAPTQCPWGQKAFSRYLGRDREEWKHWDTCELIRRSEHRFPLLVDQGEADAFLREQLLPEKLESVAREKEFPLTLNLRAGYDHSYYFVMTYLPDHIRFHQEALTR